MTNNLLDFFSGALLILYHIKPVYQPGEASVNEIPKKEAKMIIFAADIGQRRG
jgi:hypothetical protein